MKDKWLIIYFSKKLNDTTLNYSTYDKRLYTSKDFGDFTTLPLV